MNLGQLVLQLLQNKQQGAAGVVPPDGGVGGAVPVAQPAGPAGPGGLTGPTPEPSGPAPAPAAPVAEVYKSPPDLMAMYSQLMEKSNRQAAIARGMTLVAAGLAQDQNKGALIDMASQMGGGGGGAGVPTMAQMLELQKMQTAEQDKMNQRAALPGLMDKYGLDQATVQYLDATGQLDEVISSLANPDAEVVESADGSKKLINSRTGETVKELSPAKPRATEYQKLGDGSQVLVYADDKTEVATGKPLTSISAPPRETEYVDDPMGTGTKVLVYKDTKEIVPPKPGILSSVEMAPDVEVIKAADGSNVLFDKRKLEVRGTITPAEEPGRLILDRADGSKALIDNRTGTVVKELSPPAVENADKKDALAAINAERAAAGKPPMTMEEFLKTGGGGSGITINTGDNGVKYPAPDPGKDYVRNSDGTVKVFENGLPKQIIIPGSDAESKAAEDARKLAEAEAAAARDTKEATTSEVSAGVKNNIHFQDVDRAIELLEGNDNASMFDPGVGGWGGLLGFIPASNQGEFNTKIYNIGTNIGMKELQEMRNSSETGASGLGQVTEGEHQMLRQVMGALKPTDKPEVLMLNLKRIRRGMQLIADGIKDPATGKYRAPTPAEIQVEMDKVVDEAKNPPRAEIGGYKIERLDVQPDERDISDPKDPRYNPRLWPPL